MAKTLGTSTPFIIALDPTAAVTDSAGELTKYVVFDGNPTFSHLRATYHTMNFSLREVI